MEKQSAELKLPMTRVCGLDGKNMDDATFGKFRPKLLSWFLHGHHRTKGELCCAASHRKAYQQIYDNDHDWAIVLEDDAQLPDDFAQKIKEIEEKTREYDFVTLYLTRNRGSTTTVADFAYGGQLVTIAGMRTSSAALLVRRSGAHNYLKAKQIFTGADSYVQLERVLSLKDASVIPNLVSLNAETSINSQIDDQGPRKRNRRSIVWQIFIQPFMGLIVLAARNELLDR